MMNQKITTILLALVMALGLMVTAAAEGETDLSTYLNGKTTQTESVLYNPNFGRSVEVTGYVLSGGSYKLTGDLTIAAPLIVTGTVTLDLNGHVLKYENSEKRNSVIVVDDSASFTLTDSGSGGKITGGTGTNWSVTQYYITTSYNFGGGVFVGSKATFNMEGGSIVDCSVNSGQNVQGGGVYLADGDSSSKTTFTMTGGSIVNCSAKIGGGVFTDARTSFIMSNGRIADCTAEWYGGGVCSFDAFTMTSGIIEKCSTSSYGGALYVFSDAMDAQGGLCARGNDYKAYKRRHQEWLLSREYDILR